MNKAHCSFMPGYGPDFINEVLFQPAEMGGLEVPMRRGPGDITRASDSFAPSSRHPCESKGDDRFKIFISGIAKLG
jgi:hypothetical protein